MALCGDTHPPELPHDHENLLVSWQRLGSLSRGGVSERPKERASKAREGATLRGFKSRRHRQLDQISLAREQLGYPRQPGSSPSRQSLSRPPPRSGRRRPGGRPAGRPGRRRTSTSEPASGSAGRPFPQAGAATGQRDDDQCRDQGTERSKEPNGTNPQATAYASTKKAINGCRLIGSSTRTRCSTLSRPAAERAADSCVTSLGQLTVAAR